MNSVEHSDRREPVEVKLRGMRALYRSVCCRRVDFRNETSSYLFAVALAAGLYFSPDRLTLLGNGLGAAGPALFFGILFGILVHLATVQSYRDLLAEHPEPGGDIQGLQAWLGYRVTVVVAICGYLPLAVFASVGILVSAGFVFNEVFVYWFPNFAFAYLVLAAVLGVNLYGKKAVHYTMVAAVAVSGSGLFVLALAGLLKSSVPGGVLWEAGQFDYRYLSAGVIMLIGFDMALVGEYNPQKNSLQSVKPMIVAIAGSGLLLSLWGWASLIQDSSGRLATSTIPHMIAARTIFGQPGRILMGVIVIFGAFGAVNAFFYGAKRTMGRLAKNSETLKDSRYIRRVENGTLMLVAVTTALLMAGGMAGSPLLEVYIRAGLLLWLVRYAAIHGAALYSLRRTGKQGPAYLLVKGLAVFGIIFSAVGLILLESESTWLLMMLVVVPASVFIAVLGWENFLCRDRRAPRSADI